MIYRYEIEVGTTELASTFLDQICKLHNDTFSVEPFEWVDSMAQEHQELLTGLLENPTFALAVARRGDELLGFAYGHQLLADHGWWGDFLIPVLPDIKAEWTGRTFALITLAVESHARGGGLGRILVDQLFASRTEERGLLSVQPNATDTQAFYVHTGWQLIGRKGPLDGVTPSCWDIYSRPIQLNA
jgi:ribosomal protein S18 acetylase RimI-like enzyme